MSKTFAVLDKTQDSLNKKSLSTFVLILPYMTSVFELQIRAIQAPSILIPLHFMI